MSSTPDIQAKTNSTKNNIEVKTTSNKLRQENYPIFTAY